MHIMHSLAAPSIHNYAIISNCSTTNCMCVTLCLTEFNEVKSIINILRGIEWQIISMNFAITRGMPLLQGFFQLN